MAFPDDPLEHRAQFAFGADLTADPGTWEWTDVTDDVPPQSIGITRGRQAEAGAVTPGTISMVLDNTSGDYTPELATGAHYPHVVVGVPLQESLRGTSTFIGLPGTGARVSTPDGEGLGITGDFDLRVDVTLTQWHTPGQHIPLMNKGTGTGSNQSWEIGIQAGGAPYVVWRESPTSVVTVACEANLVVPPTGRLAVRAAVDVDNDNSGFTAYFWTAPTLDGEWEALGDGQTYSLASALVTSTAPVQAGHVEYPAQIGAVPPVGRLHGLEVRDGIGGTVVARVSAADITEGATSFTGAQGRTWTVTEPAGATRWYPRITAAVTGWAPDWPYGDLSNPDTGNPGVAQVAVQASGLLQRLSTGQPALASTLRRRVPSAAHLRGYWPLEDGADSSQAASGLPGGAPARLTGVTWAADDTMPGAAPLPTLGEAAALTAAVPSATPGGWHVEMVYRLGSMPTTEQTLLTLQLAAGVGGVVQALARVSTAGVHVQLLDADGDVVAHFLFDDADAIAGFVGKWNRLQIFSAPDGDDTTVTVAWRDVVADTWWYARTTYTGTAGALRSIHGSWGADFEGMAIGHVGAFDLGGTSYDSPAVTVYAGCDSGFDGELAAERMIRLCAEEGVPLLATGDVAATAPMGPQGTNTLLDLLQECADTDGGVLSEQRDRLGLKYRTLGSFYNQPSALTLDARAGEIANPFAPTASDESLRNQITATRSGGSSAIVEDTASIARAGVRPGQLDVNPRSDAQLAGIASWALHLGTAPGMRYPQITLDLAATPQFADAWLQADSGDLIEVVHLPPQHPSDAVRALMQGYTETYSPSTWTVTANCTPGQPWLGIGVLDAEAPQHCDTAGSELAEAVDATATTLSVNVTAGLTWTTDADEYPCDIWVGGEVMTLTGVTGDTSPQAFDVVRSVNGVVKAHPAGESLNLANPAVVAL
jgi:hypothetical protein